VIGGVSDYFCRISCRGQTAVCRCRQGAAALNCCTRLHAEPFLTQFAAFAPFERARCSQTLMRLKRAPWLIPARSNLASPKRCPPSTEFLVRLRNYGIQNPVHPRRVDPARHCIVEIGCGVDYGRWRRPPTDFRLRCSRIENDRRKLASKLENSLAPSRVQRIEWGQWITHVRVYGEARQGSLIRMPLCSPWHHVLAAIRIPG